MRLWLSGLFLLCLVSACDTAPSAVDSGDSLEAAQQWYESETGLTTFGQSSARVSGDAHLTQFYPDWAAGEVVTIADGSQVVVTRLWRNADVTYDSRVSFLRVLAVYLAADGSVDRASILNFVSPNPIAEDDGPALVAALADGSIHQRDVAVTDHDVLYEMRSARRYMPDGSVLDLDVSTVETSDPGPLQGRGDTPGSARFATRYSCVVQTVQYRVDVGNVDGTWRTDTWADCTKIAGSDNSDPDGDEGFFGGGNGGGGGPSSSGDGETTTQKENRLLALLAEDPFALLDVPCDEIERWLTVGMHEPSDAILDRLAELQRNESLVNRILPNEWQV